MPTTLPLAYTSSLRNPFLTWCSQSFFYLVMPPFFMMLLIVVAISCEHHSFRATAKALNWQLNLAACDEMASCHLPEPTSIRKAKRQ